MAGRDITDADPADRRIGYLPQDYELFPMRSAEWNIRFAPRMKGRKGREVEDRFVRIVEILNVGDLLHRDVGLLSGGERQRVALGRALMADLGVLILDEPVSALPESLRDAICGELKTLHASLNLTTLHVSHNLDEALSVATRLAIMDQGRVVQAGPPEEILNKPANRFVAEFTQSKNIWPAVARAGALWIDDRMVCRTPARDGAYDLVVRPEHLRLTPATGGITGHVMDSTRISHMVLTRVDLGPVHAWVRDESVRARGENVTVMIPEESVVLLPRLLRVIPHG
jgi:ABC-type Fe3+/spermidine/putrescine transport system ATPase subunit